MLIFAEEAEKERGVEPGLDNFGARRDSSRIGRFNSSDPMDGFCKNLGPADVESIQLRPQQSAYVQICFGSACPDAHRPAPGDPHEQDREAGTDANVSGGVRCLRFCSLLFHALPDAANVNIFRKAQPRAGKLRPSRRKASENAWRLLAQFPAKKLSHPWLAKASARLRLIQKVRE